jgi:hypothetical protein
MLYKKPPFGVLPPYTRVCISEHHLLNHESEKTDPVLSFHICMQVIDVLFQISGLPGSSFAVTAHCLFMH